MQGVTLKTHLDQIHDHKIELGTYNTGKQGTIRV